MTDAAEDPGVHTAVEKISDSISDLIAAATRKARAEIFTGDLRGMAVEVIGSDPFDQEDLYELTKNMGVAVNGDVPEEGFFVVIGREGFNTDMLDMCASPSHATPLEFCSQEDFFNLWLFGVPLDYYPGDPRIASHPGLSYVAERSIDWPWPSTDVSGTGNYEWETDHWRDESPLRARFGYSVSAQIGLSRRERRSILHQALNDPRDPLSLYPVAHHIAWLARMYKGREDDKYAEAIAKWEDDLAFLRRNYYDEQFQWPNTELKQE